MDKRTSDTLAILDHYRSEGHAMPVAHYRAELVRNVRGITREQTDAHMAEVEAACIAHRPDYI